MKIVSAQPSNLALATDVTDRDISSHIEIRQTTDFPLPAMPDPGRVSLPSTDVRNTSFIVSEFDAVLAGVPAGVANTLANVGRGVWRIRWRGFYSSDYVEKLIASGLRLLMTVGPGPVLATLEHIWPHNGNVRFDGEFWVVLTDASSNISIFLSNNIAAQNHQVRITIIAEKYL